MTQNLIRVGVIGKPHGVRGLVRVHAETADPASLEEYGVLRDDRGESWTLHWRGAGVAELRDASGRPVADRTAAEFLVNRVLSVPRETLPETEEDEFYHTDLVGLMACESDAEVGRIVAVHDYGAGASLELETGLLVPFTRACVPEVRIAEGRVCIVRPDEVIGDAEHDPQARRLMAETGE
ncbi:ribosome maturation factor RimM [Acetobacter sp. AN02]|uniref:ribosome maturation factor RimM n=1 Tax=Acetobacter sp. AN02 TaxID=2894186 RepID=UPI0024343CE3|nr:ribosome maturation factor RimM [Acetobacter sp. AN02]MDG6095125.1 ribosome maturation factor RimM [Acetobacter sp. AN02]